MLIGYGKEVIENPGHIHIAHSHGAIFKQQIVQIRIEFGMINFSLGSEQHDIISIRWPAYTFAELLSRV
ncbi:MAG: hypothetical protein ACLTDS_05305 [Bianqueaceae bacterium]